MPRPSDGRAGPADRWGGEEENASQEGLGARGWRRHRGRALGQGTPGGGAGSGEAPPTRVMVDLPLCTKPRVCACICKHIPVSLLLLRSPHPAPPSWPGTCPAVCWATRASTAANTSHIGGSACSCLTQRARGTRTPGPAGPLAACLGDVPT